MSCRHATTSRTGQTGRRAQHPARRRTRPGRRRAAGVRDAAARRARLRRLRARAVLREPVRILRLQHLHAGRAGRRLADARVRRHGAGRDRAGGRVLGGGPAPRIDTVFFGGGTPTMLPPEDWAGSSTGWTRPSAWPRTPR